MKFELFKIIVVLALAVLLFLSLRSCGNNATLSAIESAYKKNEAEIAKINQSYKALMDSVSALRKERQQINNYYKYEIHKIDSIYASGNVSYSLVDSILYYWTNRIYNIPGFFSFATEPADTSDGIEDSTGGGKLLLHNEESEGRKRQTDNSSW